MQDGAGQIWTVDQQGAKTVASAGPPVVAASLYAGQLRGFDMVNGYDYGNLNGCRTTNSTTTTCGSQPTDADYPNINGVLFFGDRGVAVDAAGSLWIAGGTQGTLVEVIGLAAPTLPLYIHNGVSTKP